MGKRKAVKPGQNNISMASRITDAWMKNYRSVYELMTSMAAEHTAIDPVCGKAPCFFSDVEYHRIENAISMKRTGQPAMYLSPHNQLALKQDTSMGALLWSWSQSGVIYEIDPNLQDALVTQAEDLKNIPSEALKSMPYPCVYVKTHELKWAGETIDGYFAFLDDRLYSDDGLSLVLSVVRADIDTHGTFFSIPLGDTPIADHIHKDVMRRLKEVGWDLIHSSAADKLAAILTAETSALIQCLLYIFAANSDQRLKTKTSNGHKTGAKSKKKSAGKKPAQKQTQSTQVWGVGERIGSVLKVGKENETKATRSTYKQSDGRAAVCPHIRRAHWHHYWVGKRGTPERHLKLIWQPPVAVNFGVQPKTAVTAVRHKVK